jgi:hypothetical protein
MSSQSLGSKLTSSLNGDTLDLDAFGSAVTKIYELSCKNDEKSVSCVCECLSGQGAKLVIRVLLDAGVENDIKLLIISCIRQCALIERLQMDLLRAGTVDALIYILREGSQIGSEERQR